MLEAGYVVKSTPDRKYTLDVNTFYVQQETQKPPTPSLSNINFQNSAGQVHISNYNY